MEYINCDFPIQFERIQQPGPASRAVIVLHGYAENLELMKERFAHIQTDADLIFYQGFFPLPRKKNEQWELNYAWYFHDDFKDGYLIPPQFPAKLINEHLKKFDYESYIIIGYSQGGYLAPFIAKANLSVEQVIGIGCQFLFDKLELDKLHFKLSQFHAKNDEVINPSKSIGNFQKFLALGNKGEFTFLADQTHLFPNNVVTLIERLLRSNT